MVIRNHGISQSLIDKVRHETTTFMKQPQEYKNEFVVNNDDYGYFPAARDGKGIFVLLLTN